ncbi:hypothetical protein [Bacillus sp. FSL R7-0685]|uniref:hypothetical protein n=1 Tax=Bacillus sp. FSL R7-0685 TaxID=2921589 RepID=UPI0030FCCE17
MAKLEGVKTLDMVNGEITKVAYGVATYERVEGKAEAGDLALAIKSAEDATLGNFYPVTDISYGEIMYMDDADDAQVNPLEYFRIFRKVNASTNPSVEERVAKAEDEIESLKSDVAALKGEAEYKRIDADEAKVGDYVKYIDSDYLDICDYSFTIGKLYEIKAVDEDGDFEHEADNGERLMACPDDEELEFYRKVSAASVEAEPKPERLKVGDYAKVVGGAGEHLAEINDIVQVTFDDGGSLPFRCDDLSGKSVGWFYEGELVRATDEEVAEAKRAAAARAKFKEGAKVRLLSGGGNYPLNGFENGKVYEVSDSNFDHKTRGKGIRIEGGDCFDRSGFAMPDQLEILSEEEAAERKKWAEIGREVGEYKKGDVVAYDDPEWFGNSGIGEVVGFDIGTPRVGSVNRRGDKVSMYLDPDKLRLITPVEARFDR